MKRKIDLQQLGVLSSQGLSGREMAKMFCVSEGAISKNLHLEKYRYPYPKASQSKTQPIFSFPIYDKFNDMVYRMERDESIRISSMLRTINELMVFNRKSYEELVSFKEFLTKLTSRFEIYWRAKIAIKNLFKKNGINLEEISQEDFNQFIKDKSDQLESMTKYKIFRKENEL